jgi:hypothetical protein
LPRLLLLKPGQDNSPLGDPIVYLTPTVQPSTSPKPNEAQVRAIVHAALRMTL